MSLSLQIAKKQIISALVSGAGVELMTLIRQVIIARLVGGDSLGAFMLLMIGLRFLQMATDLAGDRYLLSRPDRSVKDALDLVHAYALLRAFFCILMVLVAASVMPVSVTPAAIMLIALAILAKGVVHQGFRIEQRQMRFDSLLQIELVPAVLATIALPGLLWIAPIDVAFATTLLIQQGGEAIASWVKARGYIRQHGFSPRLYGLSHLARYGAPLMVASWVLFCSMQGERALFGLKLSLDQFTPLAIAIQLALIPALLAGRLALTIGLPWMRGQDRRALDAWIARRLPVLAVLLAGSVAVFALFGPWLVATLYGSDLVLPSGMMTLIALVQIGRVLRAPDSIAAQAVGRTTIPMAANIVRAVALPFVAIVLAFEFHIETCFLPLIAGELLAFIIQRAAVSRVLSAPAAGRYARCQAARKKTRSLSPIKTAEEALS